MIKTKKTFKLFLYTLFIILMILFYSWCHHFWVTITTILFFSPLFFVSEILLLKKNLNKWLAASVKYLYFFFCLLFFVIICRVYFIGFYFIPSNSMERTISEGDIVVLNKLAYGSKIPQKMSDIPYGEILSNLINKDVEFTLYEIKLTGFKLIERNEIVVFNHGVNSKRNLIKRVIGLPGENIKIIDSKVYVDNNLLDEMETYVFEYIYKDNNLNDQVFTLSNKEFKNYKSQIVRNIHLTNKHVDNIYPFDKVYEWTRDNYGSVIIPKREMKIELNKEMFSCYQEIIQNELNDKFKSFQDYKEKKGSDSYIFKYDYYFLMGDNRHFSSDSRSIGFISSDDILGKLLFTF